jgi:2'-5' RNA ligase
MGSHSAGLDCVSCYGLIQYIPDALGDFLNLLRRRLVNGCSARSHISLLPPRPLSGSEANALAELTRLSHRIAPFEVELTNIAVFPKTNVIYLEVGRGQEDIYRVHHQLATGPLQHREAWQFHPHVTLAQEIPVDLQQEAEELARDTWSRWGGSRRFLVDELTFVRLASDESHPDCYWQDLEPIRLQPSASELAQRISA